MLRRLCIACGFPLLLTFTRRNTSIATQSALLQAMNVQANSVDDCDFLKSVVDSWIQANAESGGSDGDVLTYTVHWARLLPVRCTAWQKPNGVITLKQSPCAETPTPSSGEELSLARVVECFAGETTLRVAEYSHKSLSDFVVINATATEAFSVDIVFDNSRTVAIA